MKVTIYGWSTRTHCNSAHAIRVTSVTSGAAAENLTQSRARMLQLYLSCCGQLIQNQDAFIAAHPSAPA
jgi:hypothetical protein